MIAITAIPVGAEEVEFVIQSGGWTKNSSGTFFDVVAKAVDGTVDKDYLDVKCNITVGVAKVFDTIEERWWYESENATLYEEGRILQQSGGNKLYNIRWDNKLSEQYVSPKGVTSLTIDLNSFKTTLS